MTITTEHPSTEHTAAWLWAVHPDYEDPESAAYNPGEPSLDPEVNTWGKWTIRPVAPEQVDALWAKVSAAVGAGDLGPEAKVSTALGQGVSADRDGTHAIVVYTRDWHDEADVTRVLVCLRSLGIDQSLTYKRDVETLRGVYGSGSGLYFAPDGSAVALRTKAYGDLLGDGGVR